MLSDKTYEKEKSEGRMSRLKEALYEVHHVDEMATRDTWLNRIHPLAKVLVTVFFIAVTVSHSKYDCSGILRMGVYLIVVYMLGELPVWDSIKRLRLILPLVCVVGIFNPIFDRQPYMTVGNIVISAGVISMLTLMLKGIFSVFAAYALIASTSIEKICYALRILHIPKILVTQILLTYRYITVLLREANAITQAYSLRAPGQKGIHFKVWGSLSGQLLLRSIDRANEIYESMVLRGYRDEFSYVKVKAFSGADYGYLIIWIVVLLFLR